MKLIQMTREVSAKFGDFDAVEMIAQAGFDGLDYTMYVMGRDENHPLCQDDYKDYAKKLKEQADKNNISFLQGHAVCPTYIAGDDEYNKSMYDKLLRSIEISGILGIKHLVVHPTAPERLEKGTDLKKFNIDYYNSLKPYAKENNVKICLENMWGKDQNRQCFIPNVCSYAKDLAEYLDELNDDIFTICYDLGHGALIGENAEDAIRILGSKRLGAIHAHDNNYRGDDHTLPFHGKLNWTGIIKALEEIDYTGNFTFEADEFLKNLPASKTIISSALKYMHDLGRYIIKEIEK